MSGNSVVITLPYSKTVVIQAFANASYLQRVSVQPQGGPTTVWSGGGFYSTPLGSMTITTPAGSGAGFPVTVTIDHSSDGGRTWSGSKLASVPCDVMYYSTIIIGSEDANDNTWNDATAYVTWSQLPAEAVRSSRTDASLRATPTSSTGRA